VSAAGCGVEEGGAPLVCFSIDDDLFDEDDNVDVVDDDTDFYITVHNVRAGHRP
jgi:hypothetical protein